MRSLGLDVGDRRIGVAMSDPLGIMASPMEVFEHSDDDKDISHILRTVKQFNVQIIIVGLPQSMNGSLGVQAGKVQSFAEKLKEASPVPVEYRDERLTTVEAKRMLEEASPKKSFWNKKIEYDAAAAAIILQSYLNEAKPLEYPPVNETDESEQEY
jgi:putative holliday junction resolvase